MEAPGNRLVLVAVFACVVSYTTNLFGNITPSLPRLPESGAARSDLNTENSAPYSFRTVRAFFTSRRIENNVRSR